MALAPKSRNMPYAVCHRLLLAVISGLLFDASSASIVASNFMNTNASRMTFMVNFDVASVICQKSSNPEDLALYPISALCDGVRQCVASPNMDDESFPFCSRSCNPPCGPSGTCLLDGGKAQCYCNQGYSGKTCAVQDTNECAKKPCHWLAKCTNTYGSYYCSCLPGFSGDGQNCTDIDECSIESIAKKCPPHSECCNVPGSYFCNCTEGFRPRGTPLQSCDDIDECEEKLARCPAGTACVNTVGSYKCAPSQFEAFNCSGGYEVHDGKCIDIDECRKPDACAPRATCTNAEGGYHCACPAGFTGDGKSCTPLTDCSANPAVCHTNAFCVSDLRMCLCQSGYIGDGISCFDMNECASDHWPCKVSEKCVNTNGSYACCAAGVSDASCLEGHPTSQCSEGCGKRAECVAGQCVCKAGFSGNPVTGCTDVDECKEDPNLCTNGQWCVNFEGGHVCCSHGAPISRCQGLVIGIWNKKDKPLKKSTTTPIFDLATSASTPTTTNPTPADSKTTSNAETSCSPSQRKYCELRSNKTCSIIDAHPECTDCLSGYAAVAGECILLDRASRGGSECRDPTKNDCHLHATCLDVSPSGHLCACKDGFIGDGKRCDDVDECYAPTLCSPNAKCINEIGSFRCVCKPGFAGDGRFCTAVCPGGGFPHLTFGPCSQEADHCPSGFVCEKEQCCPLADVPINCEINPSVCGENANCVEKQCVCDSGYTRNGSRCKDVNECLDPEPICAKDQKCFNVPGNFACCPGKSAQDKGLCEGLEKNCSSNPSLCPSSPHCVNGSCGSKISSNDCRTNHTLCHPNAECNATGDGGCYCSLGYVGDGHQCKPDPEDCFLNLRLCDLTRSRCVDRRCQCLDGFHGNGTTCQDGKCENQPSLCHRNADCIQGQCACKDGFVGNGLSCVPDPNDCQSYPHMCHARASCKMRRCHCNDGFQGDGKSCTPTDAKNCQLAPEICGPNAYCNETRCHCKLGYLGDGETGCWIDPEDCVLTPSRCPGTAECIERRCKCSRGYVGNGTDCTVDLEDCEAGGLKCHQNAKCVNQKKCQCEVGYEGDGVKACEKVELDCQVNVSICHPKAECRQIRSDDGHGAPSKWRCKCLDGYEGNGRDCREAGKVTPIFDSRPNGTRVPRPPPTPLKAYTTPASSTAATVSGASKLSNASSPTLGNKTLCAEPVTGDCHPSADCATLDNGKHACQCRHGFSGDGRNCQDINECSLRLAKCHPLATCINTIGSHLCLCPQGYKGDGVQTCIARNETESRDRLDVECQDDGIVLLYVDKSGDGTSANFNGRIFIKTQSQNPYCSKDFTSSDGPVYKFKAPFAYCDVKTEPHNTFSVVVVIQKHPLFVTEADEAYSLRCTYPVGELPLMSHFNVSMLATAATYVNNGTTPQCALKVLAQEPAPSGAFGISSNLDDNAKWQEVSEAIVGQKVQLLLSVEPKNLYGLLARNCMAVNMDSGESYQLTNSRGCAVDTAIFPEWTQQRKYQLYAKFLTFKWPDTAHIRFQCDCSPCFEQCEPIQCGSNTGWGRKKRSASEEAGNQRQSPNPVFSSVLRIRDVGAMDGQEEHMELEEESKSANQSVWLSEYYGGASLESEDVCIHSVIFATALGLAASLAASVCAVGLCGWRSHRRRASPASIIQHRPPPPSFKYWTSALVGNGNEESKRRPHLRSKASASHNAAAADTYRSDATLYS